MLSWECLIQKAFSRKSRASKLGLCQIYFDSMQAFNFTAVRFLRGAPAIARETARNEASLP